MFCWRILNILDGRELMFQDVPILKGMLVYYINDDRTIESRRVGFVQSPYWHACDQPKTVQRLSHRTCVTREAAVKLVSPTITAPKLAAYWARVRNAGTTGTVGASVLGASTECWPWAGEVDDKGFGQVQFGEWKYPAHGIAYDLFNKGGVDTTTPRCGNKLCCNPRHQKVK